MIQQVLSHVPLVTIFVVCTIGSFQLTYYSIRASDRKASRARNSFLQAACDGDVASLSKSILTGQNIEIADKNGSNALMLAAWAGREEAVLLLLHSGANVHGLSHRGWTALTYAARAGEATTVQVLLEWGADANVIETTTGATPLMFAAFVGSLRCVELLLEYGADTLVRTKQGAMAFAFAEENGHDGIAGMLRHRAAEAQAESKALKEQKEAIATRHKAQQASLQRKREAQAYVRKLEAQRQKFELRKTRYLASFSGQMEILSVGCFMNVSNRSIVEYEKNLIESVWDTPADKYVPSADSLSVNEFETLHTQLLYTRMQMGLSRPFPCILNDQQHVITGSLSDSDTENSSCCDDSDATPDINFNPMDTHFHQDQAIPFKLRDILIRITETLVNDSNESESKISLGNIWRAIEGQNLDIVPPETEPSTSYYAMNICTGLGNMANGHYLSLKRSNRFSTMSTIMPYFMDVSPNVILPLAKTIVVLVEKYLQKQNSDTPEILVHKGITGIVQVIRLHLFAIRRSRFDIDTCKESLPILGDALQFLLSVLPADASSADPLRSLTSACLAENLLLFVHSPVQLNKYLLQIWNQQPNFELRHGIVECLVSYKAVSFLVASDADAPYPHGPSSGSKHRLRGVVGMSFKSSLHSTSRRASRLSRVGTNPSVQEDAPLSAESPKNQAAAPPSKALRVRFRSVLGESNRLGSSALKRRSKAILTLQRAVRIFVQSAKGKSVDQPEVGVENAIGEPEPSVRTVLSISEIEQSLTLSRDSVNGYSLSTMDEESVLPPLVEKWLSSENTVVEELQGKQRGSPKSRCPPPDAELTSKVSEWVKLPSASFVSFCGMSSMTKIPASSPRGGKGYIDILDMLLHDIVTDENLDSMRLLKSIQDDLFSRVYAKYAYGDDSAGSVSGNMKEKSLESKLVDHIVNVLHQCSDNSLRRISKKKKKVANPMIVQFACDMLDQLHLVSSVCVGLVDNTVETLLDVTAQPSVANVVRDRAVGILCTAAKGKICMPATLDPQIEALLIGPLFSHPSTSETFAESDVFLEELARSPAPPVHNSTALALHSRISKAAPLRFLVAQASGKPGVLEDVVRICAAAFLKHTRTAPLAIQTAQSESDISPKLISIWKAAWQSASTIISTFRKNQKHVCATEGCNLSIVKDGDGWRCEVGHVNPTHETAEGVSYDYISAQMAARARLLLYQESASLIQDEPTTRAVLQHARKFVESASSDRISSDTLDLYLKSKARTAVLRNKGFQILRRVLNVLRQPNLRIVDEQTLKSVYTSAVQTAATVAPSFPEVRGRRDWLTRSNSINDVDQMMDYIPRHHHCPSLSQALVAVRNIYASFSKGNTESCHPLAYQVPSPMAGKILENSLALLDVLVSIAESSSDESDIVMVLFILKKLALKAADFDLLASNNILTRIFYFCDSVRGLPQVDYRQAAWSIFTRMALEVVAGNAHSTSDGESTMESDEIIIPAEDCFVAGFHEIHALVAHLCISEIRKSLLVMENSQEDQQYETSEENCYRFVCLLGSLCSSNAFASHFASLCIHMENEDHPHLALSIILSPSPRVQQLGIALARRLLIPYNPVSTVKMLFELAGSWSLSEKADVCMDLAYLLSDLLRHLCSVETWKSYILHEVDAAAKDYVSGPYSPSVYYRMWTALTIFDLRAPCSLRSGSRVKIVPNNIPLSSSVGDRAGEEYGVVISCTNKRGLPSSGQADRHCMVVLDSEPVKIPVHFAIEEVIPVGLIPDHHKGLFFELRNCKWFLKVIMNFCSRFFNEEFLQDIVWCELKTVSMAVLHSWLSMDTTYVVESMMSRGDQSTWKHIMSICVQPAPSIELDQVDDLSSTHAAFADLKAVLCELGSSPVSTALHRPSIVEKVPPRKAVSEAIVSSASEPKGNLLADPSLQPGKRAEMIRQMSAQSFVAKEASLPFMDVYMEDMESDQGFTNDPVLVPRRTNIIDRNGVDEEATTPSRAMRSYSSSALRMNVAPSPSPAARKRVTFESSSSHALQTPFAEFDNAGQQSYRLELQVERNRRRLRGERRRRAARRRRTLSSTSARLLDLGVVGDADMPSLEAPLGVVLCEPDTPRGREAPAISLQVELPTVDTVLSVPMSTRASAAHSPMRWNQDGRAVVEENTRLRVSANEIGIVEKIETALNGSEVALLRVLNSSTGLRRTVWRDIANFELSQDIIADKYKLKGMSTENDESSEPNIEALIRIIADLCTRSGILWVRRAAMTVISVSVVTHSPSLVKLLTSEASDAAQIFGMIKLCDGSSAQENSLAAPVINLDTHFEDPILTGSWKAVSVLSHDDPLFADMLLDESALFLANAASDTLFFETQHPLCPMEDSDIPPTVPEESGEEGSSSPTQQTTTNNVSLPSPSVRSPNPSQVPKPIITERPMSRKLAGSHRFHIEGARGLLVEFDRRCAIVSTATQVTLSYDPQDREVIKVLGEGSADAWVPVVVYGDTCYLHWSVNAQDIESVLHRIDELGVDINDAAWGIAARVRRLDETTNLDEKEVLQRPMGSQLLNVVASNAPMVLARVSCGIHFFNTAIKYLRTANLAFKPDLCEVLTVIVRAFMELENKVAPEWRTCISEGLYQLHYDLLAEFDVIAEFGFSVVVPYFTCLLELLIVSRPVWSLNMRPDDTSRVKAPICAFALFGNRPHAKIVVDCVTCGLDGHQAVCMACAATCHKGHTLKDERTSPYPCGCSIRLGPDTCLCLRPYADMWSIIPSDRTWFDVVCQTADVIDCMTSGTRSLPMPFIREACRSNSDGKILRLCLRSLEECLRNEVQYRWWNREARHMWANMMDQGMDSVPEVAFALQVLVSSLLPSTFSSFFKDGTTQKNLWLKKIYTNQSSVLAQAMLQFQFALATSSFYPEWDSRVQNWIATLERMVGAFDEDCCSYLITEEFPRPQIYYKCKTCSMEICDYCAHKLHLEKGHKIGTETYGSGYCDEKTVNKDIVATNAGGLFETTSSKNFHSLLDLYWLNQRETNENTELEAQVPTEPRTLAALLNVPREFFLKAQDQNDDESKNTEESQSKEKSSEKIVFNVSLVGILLELLNVRDCSSILIVNCDADNAYALTLAAFLAHNGRSTGSAIVHGVASCHLGALDTLERVRRLRGDASIAIGHIDVYAVNLFSHIRAVSDYTPKSGLKSPGVEAPELLKKYDRIFCIGSCTFEQLEMMSAILSSEGILLCPMIDSLKYGVYAQRNSFTGKCENRTLAPLYEECVKFKKEVNLLQPIGTMKPPSNEENLEQTLENLEALRNDNEKYFQQIRDTENSLFELAAKPVRLDVWMSLSDFANSACRDTNMLGSRDLTLKSLESFPALQRDELDVTRIRFAALKRANESLSEVLPLVNLKPKFKKGCTGEQLSNPESKKLAFLATKLESWSKFLESGWSTTPTSSMPSITVSRKLVLTGDINDTLFLQTFNQIQSFPLESLRRRDQSFKVRFAGEGGHDVGGLYRDLFSEMCGELKSGKPKLLFHPSAMSKIRGTPLLPIPSLTSPLDLRLFEFLGLLMGVACLRHGITLSLDFSPLLWKYLVAEPLREADLRFVDDSSFQAVSYIRKTKTQDLEGVLPDTFFVITPSDAEFDNSSDLVSGYESSIMQPQFSHHHNGQRLVELCPLGKQVRVTAENAHVYASLVESFRMKEFNIQLNSLRCGLSSLIPTRLLPMFAWQELENVVCGVPDVDVEYLQSRTKYVGGVLKTDLFVKYFWDVLSDDFTPRDRTLFLRFVWGRERMSTADESATFIIGPHIAARNSGNPDKWLPLAHTCFFSLDLPAYSSREITKSKLLFAINNCNAIDADDTGEGHANMSLDL